MANPGSPITITVAAQTADASAKMQRFFGQTVAGFNRLSGASNYLNGLGAKLAAAFTVGALVNFGRHAINTADEMGKLSQRVGIAVDQLDGLRRQGEVNDLVFSELSMGLSLFNDRIFAAIRQGGATAQIFRDLGVSVQDVNGVMRSNQAILEDVANAFAAMPDGPQKTAAAIDLFSRSGKQWIPLLNQGADGMRRMRDEGGGITPEMATDAEHFNDSLTELKQSLDAIFISVSRDVLPILQAFTQWLKTSSQEANANGVATGGLVNVLKGLASAVVVVSYGFAQLGKVIGVSAALWFENFSAGVDAARVILMDYQTQMKKTIVLFLDLARSSVIASELIRGNPFKIGELRESIDQIKSDLEGFADPVKNAVGTAVKFNQDMLERTKALAKMTFFDIGMDVLRLGNTLKAIWDNVPKTPNTPAPKTQTPPPGQSVTSEAAKKLIEEIDKAYTESTRGKIALLDDEEAALKQRVNLEIFDTELAQREVTKITATYAAKRKEILDKTAEEMAQRRQKELDDERNKIEEDWRLTEAEKFRRMQSEGLKTEGPDPSSFVENLTAAWVQLQNTIGTVAQAAAGTLNSLVGGAIDNISNGITGLIMGTQTWAGVLRQIGSSVLQTVIQGIVRMFVAWIMGDNAKSAVVSANASKEAAAKAPGAMMDSISSFGVAAAIGLALFIAAMAATRGFSEGGYTGDGGRREVAGAVHRGEFVMNAERTAKFRPVLEAMHETGRMPNVMVSESAQANMGIIAPGGPSRVQATQRQPSSEAGDSNAAVNVKTIVVANFREAALEAMRSEAGEKIVVQTIDGRRIELGHNT